MISFGAIIESLLQKIEMQTLKKILVLLVLPLLVVSTAKHEYYVSVTEVAYVKDKGSLQIITQIFIDDFEKLIQERYDETIVLGSGKESLKTEGYMKRYIADKLLVNINGQDVAFNFLGKEYKDDIVYCYLEIENISDINSISIQNRVLFDVFSEQQNIVRLKVNNINKSFLLISDKDNCLLNFD